VHPSPACAQCPPPSCLSLNRQQDTRGSTSEVRTESSAARDTVSRGKKELGAPNTVPPHLPVPTPAGPARPTRCSPSAADPPGRFVYTCGAPEHRPYGVAGAHSGTLTLPRAVVHQGEDSARLVPGWSQG